MWIEAFISFSLSESLKTNRANCFSNFLVKLAIFSSYNLIHIFFFSFFLVRFWNIAFKAAIYSFQLFVGVVMISMTTILEDLASVF